MTAAPAAPPPSAGRPWRRVAGLLPGLLLLLGAAVLLAHDATWSTWVGMAVGVIGLFAVALPVTYGHGRGIAVFGAGLAVAFGGVGLVHGGWLGAVGHEDAAVVTGSTHTCVSNGRYCHEVHRLTLATAGGATIPGHLDLADSTEIGVV